jgi:hypothetical protein
MLRMRMSPYKWCSTVQQAAGGADDRPPVRVAVLCLVGFSAYSSAASWNRETIPDAADVAEQQDHQRLMC